MNAANLFEISSRARGPDGFQSQAKAPFDLVMRDTFTAIELRQSLFDLRKKHQFLDSIINRRVFR